jgi:hypothetical protein
MTLDKQKKKELASAYAQSFRPMGIFQIRNTENGKIYVGASMDLDGMRNRIAFIGGLAVPFFELKEDWQHYGAERFVFEILDQLKPLEESQSDRSEPAKYRKELDALLELWLEKLQPYDNKGYNKRKTRA